MRTYRFSITWPLDFRGKYRAVWTAPAELRCGDLLLLYEAGVGGGRKAIVAVGRALTDAVRAYRGDAAHWAWVDWQTAASALAYADAQRVARFSVRGPHSELQRGEFERLAAALVSRDGGLERRLQRWKDGHDFPRTNEVPLRDLVLASWYASASERELDWYDDIVATLQSEGWVIVDSTLRAAVRGLRGPLTHDPRGGEHGLRPDRLLMRPRTKRVLVVEVKRVAVPTRGYRNPPDQVLDYARAIRKALTATTGRARRDWSVDPLLVAGEFSPLVLTEAATARLPAGVNRIRCRIWANGKLSADLLDG